MRPRTVIGISRKGVAVVAQFPGGVEPYLLETTEDMADLFRRHRQVQLVVIQMAFGSPREPRTFTARRNRWMGEVIGMAAMVRIPVREAHHLTLKKWVSDHELDVDDLKMQHPECMDWPGYEQAVQLVLYGKREILGTRRFVPIIEHHD